MKTALLKTAFRTASTVTVLAASLALTSPAGAASDPPFPGTPEQIRDTGPCGPTGAFKVSDWAQTTTDSGIRRQVNLASMREGWYWRHDDNTLWRGDTRTDPEPIFRDGLTPFGDDLTPLAEWITGGGGQNTAHLSTSCDRWVAQYFATSGANNPQHTGWVYAIQAPGGIDVNATARMTGIQSPYLWNKEIDFPGGVQGRFIQGACQYQWIRPEAGKPDIYKLLGCRANSRFNPAVGAAKPAAGVPKPVVPRPAAGETKPAAKPAVAKPAVAKPAADSSRRVGARS
ncbi:hypothetical protein ACFS5L_31120 [Streptomyces phyllanthi]|uniref:scabin-related ADP-ribosyltransferase n=1 Tax=Streptomyces phyllanthi TaxID=1803180 RepID=UPI001883541D|nr:hypothetical protein [Streptomyces phyllanthi]